MDFEELRKRRGMFTVHRSMVESDTANLIEAFKGMIIVRAEMNFMRNSIDYEAFSVNFDEVDDAHITPTYQIMVELDDDENLVSIDFIRGDK